MVNRLRLLSGVVLMAFLIMHLGNHTLGLISLEALGDNVNLAARLEAQSKELGATLVISLETLKQARVNISGATRHSLMLRDLARPVDVVAVTGVEDLQLSAGDKGGNQ